MQAHLLSLATTHRANPWSEDPMSWALHITLCSPDLNWSNSRMVVAASCLRSPARAKIPPVLPSFAFKRFKLRHHHTYDIQGMIQIASTASIGYDARREKRRSGTVKTKIQIMSVLCMSLHITGPTFGLQM